VLVVRPWASPYNDPNVNNVIMIALALLTYGNPPFLGWIWFRRLTRDGKETKWRAVSLWAAMSLATVAELVLWTAVWFFNPFSERGALFTPLMRLSVWTAIVALATSLFASGRERKWVVASAFIVPVSWFTLLMME
jgi:hypothetical protein